MTSLLVVAALALPPMPDGDERMPTALRNVREIGAALATGRTLDVGIGAGYGLRVAVGSSAVSQYVGVDILPAICESWKSIEPLGHRIVCGDIVALAPTLQGQFDTIIWDAGPLLADEGRRIVGDGAALPGTASWTLAHSMLRPGGRLIVYIAGSEEPPPDAKCSVELRIHVTDLDGEPWVVGVYRCR